MLDSKQKRRHCEFGVAIHAVQLLAQCPKHSFQLRHVDIVVQGWRARKALLIAIRHLAQLLIYLEGLLTSTGDLLCLCLGASLEPRRWCRELDSDNIIRQQLHAIASQSDESGITAVLDEIQTLDVLDKQTFVGNPAAWPKQSSSSRMYSVPIRLLEVDGEL